MTLALASHWLGRVKLPASEWVLFVESGKRAGERDARKRRLFLFLLIQVRCATGQGSSSLVWRNKASSLPQSLAIACTRTPFK
jgi:hypothetical protein